MFNILVLLSINFFKYIFVFFRPKDKIHNQELNIMEIIEKSCMVSAEGNLRKALDYAKDASNKERILIRYQEQTGLSDSHNMDLTYSVCLISFICLIHS